jgi:hypothetical protein
MEKEDIVPTIHKIGTGFYMVLHYSSFLKLSECHDVILASRIYPAIIKRYAFPLLRKFSITEAGVQDVEEYKKQSRNGDDLLIPANGDKRTRISLKRTWGIGAFMPSLSFFLYWNPPIGTDVTI